jgi:hypothetical protein
MAIKNKLNHDEILISEYNYIANTAFQANEDRSRVTSFYFVSTGSLIAAIFGTQFAASQIKNVSPAFFILFLVLTILGALTIAQLARLRAAWHESVQAMNIIKDHYINDDPDIAPAFKWRMSSIPATDKPHSIANLMAVEVALLGALTTGAATYFLMNSIATMKFITLIPVFVSFPIGYLSLWAWYKHLLIDNQ